MTMLNCFCCATIVFQLKYLPGKCWRCSSLHSMDKHQGWVTLVLLCILCAMPTTYTQCVSCKTCPLPGSCGCVDPCRDSALRLENYLVNSQRKNVILEVLVSEAPPGALYTYSGTVNRVLKVRMKQSHERVKRNY